MKRIAIASSGFLLTFGLAIFAIAVAQRDSRERVSVLETVDPDYAHQKPEPIAFPVAADQTKAAPRNFLRTIVEPIMEEMPDDPSIAPLDQAQSKSWPDEELITTTPFDQSKMVFAAGHETPPQGNAGLVAPPGLLTAPQAANTPKPLNAMPSLGAPRDTTPSPPSISGPSSMLNVPNSANEKAQPNSNASAPPKYPLTERLAQPPTLPNNATPLPLPTMQSNGAAERSMTPAPAFPVSTPNPQASSPLANPYSTTAVPSLATPPADTSRPPASLPPASLPSTSMPSSSLPSSSQPSSLQPSSLRGNDLEPASRREAATLGAKPNAYEPSQDYRPSSVGAIRNSPASNLSKAGGVLLASAAPGARQMDGAQNPSLQIQKRAPEEVQVGQPATFALLVRNVGNATAYEVSVVDSVPRGTRLSKTSPPAESRADGTLVWSLGEMAAGSEQVLSVELIPETEGEIGSVASVNFAAQASVRTVSTQPKLIIKQVADNKILLGKPLRIRVTVANEGTGVARGVSLEEDVPSGLRHPSGDFLGAPFGDLVPGQSRTIELELMTVKPGNVRNQMRAVAANSAGSDSVVDVEVVAPKLAVSVAGPGLRYLERQATYQVSVTNQGTSTAHNVEIIANLPRGLQYNSSGNHGEYRTDQHAVSWGLEELAVGATATTELTLLPVEDGEFSIRVQSQAVGVQSEPFDKPIRIEGQSELAFSIEDDNDPIEVDGQTTYAVQLSNTGTRVDEDVQVMIELPKGAKVLQVNGPVGFKETQQGLLFEPIAQMRAKDQQMFRFSVQLTQNGVQVVRAHVKSKLRPVAVVKEESTEVYRDQ